MKKKIIEYIGKTYEEYNCFDLVKDFYKDQFEIDLSNYFEGGPVPSRQEVETLVVSNKGDFVQVEKPSYGDIIVIALYGLECHIAVSLGGDSFIHSVKGVGSCMEKLPKYSRMVAGFYRHRMRA